MNNNQTLSGAAFLLILGHDIMADEKITLFIQRPLTTEENKTSSSV